jgi:hypothetical protein
LFNPVIRWGPGKCQLIVPRVLGKHNRERQSTNEGSTFKHRCQPQVHVNKSESKAYSGLVGTRRITCITVISEHSERAELEFRTALLTRILSEGWHQLFKIQVQKHGPSQGESKLQSHKNVHITLPVWECLEGVLPLHLPPPICPATWKQISNGRCSTWSHLVHL